jgi:hypothetical protein
MLYTLMIPGAIFAIALVVMVRAENRSVKRRKSAADRWFTEKDR